MIVIGIEDLKYLYFDHNETYNNVGELVCGLKQLVMDEINTKVEPNIMVLGEGSKI